MTVSAHPSPAVEVSLANATDERRFAAIHGLYCQGVWRYLRRLGLSRAEADDAAQQIFLVVAQRLGDIRPESERAFVYGVASRTASGVRRQAARRREVEAPTDDKEGTSDHAEELLEERRRRRLLDDILSAMTPELRAVFVLFEVEELPMREIATILELAPGTVASRLRRAREDFRQRAGRCRKGGAP
jgi:RNA polymerase sigma-70 factor (ECF subfamily)